MAVYAASISSAKIRVPHICQGAIFFSRRRKGRHPELRATDDRRKPIAALIGPNRRLDETPEGQYSRNPHVAITYGVGDKEK
jgi:hypothetical protein